MKLHDYNYIADASGWVFTAVQTDHIFQLISIILVCLSTALSLAYNLYKWWKEAKSDGHITKEEIDEGAKIVNDHLKQIDDIKKKKEE